MVEYYMSDEEQRLISNICYKVLEPKAYAKGRAKFWGKSLVYIAFKAYSAISCLEKDGRILGNPIEEITSAQRLF